jgi:hypothetical protein
MQPENPQRSAVVLRLPVSPKIRPASPYSRPAPEPATPPDARTQIFNTVRFVSYERVNEVETIEELIADLDAVIIEENERFPEAIRLKAHSVKELAKTLSEWSWKNKRKPKVEIAKCAADDHLEHAIAEIRILGQQGKAFALLQLLRKNHAGSLFPIQPVKMAASRYSGARWTQKAYKDARDVLLREGFIAVHEKAPRRPVQYALAEKRLTAKDRDLNAVALKTLQGAA